MNKAILYYYSLEGNTAFAAETIHTITGIEIEQLLVRKEPPKAGWKKFVFGGKSAIMKENPGLTPVTHDPADYQNVILAYPIWAGVFPPAINAFLKKYSLQGKTIYVVATSASGNAEKSVEKIRKRLPDSHFGGSISLVDPLKHPEEVTQKIKQWVEVLA